MFSFIPPSYINLEGTKSRRGDGGSIVQKEWKNRPHPFSTPWLGNCVGLELEEESLDCMKLLSFLGGQGELIEV